MVAVMTADAGAGLDIGFAAGLSASLGRMESGITTIAGLMDREARRQARLDEAVRFVKPPAATGAISAAGALTLDLGGPATGYMWTVRRVTVSDALSVPSSMASAVGYLYAGVIGSVIVPQNLEWLFPTCPNSATFGAGHIVLQYGEHLYLVIAGGTSAQVVQASVAYQLYASPGWTAET